jgi:hypothetical protein
VTRRLPPASHTPPDATARSRNVIPTVSPVAPTGLLADALTPTKLRRDGIRLGLISSFSIIYALVFEQRVLDFLLIGLNGFGVLIGALALIFAAVAIREHGRTAFIALVVYGACTIGHVAAIILLLRH